MGIATAKKRFPRGRSALSGLLLLFAVACQSPAEQAQQYAAQAQGLADAGNLPGALEAINKALSLRDDHAEYFLLQGTILLGAGRVAAAFDAFKRALELDDANVQALSQVASLGLQLGQTADADDAADRLLVLQPNALVGLQVKGLIALNKEHYDQAGDYAAKMLVLNPSDEAGTIIQVRTLAKSEHYEEAADRLNKAMLVAGPTAALLITKLNFHRALHQPEQMVTVLDQLISGTKGVSPAFELDRINLLYKMGRTARARQLALEFLGRGSSNAADYGTIKRIWQEFDPQPLAPETIALARSWSDPLAVNMVGRYLLWQGQPRLAADFIAAVPPQARATNLSIAARATAALGQEAQARQAVDGILAASPDDVDGLLLHAQFASKAGRANFAIEAGQRAVNTDPLDPEAYVVLAALNRANHQDWRARQVFEDGVKRLPQDFLITEKYTQFLHELGDKGRAVSVARSLARALPSSVKAWTFYLAQCNWAGDTACEAEAGKGRVDAQKAYRIDPPPGGVSDRGLLGEF